MSTKKLTFKDFPGCDFGAIKVRNRRACHILFPYQRQRLGFKKNYNRKGYWRPAYKRQVWSLFSHAHLN